MKKKMLLKVFSLSAVIIVIIVVVVILFGASIKCYLPIAKSRKVCLTPEFRKKIEKVLNSKEFSIYKIEENSNELIISVELLSYDKLIVQDIPGIMPAEILTKNPFSELIFSYVLSPKMSEIANDINKKVKVRVFQNLKHIKNAKISSLLRFTDERGKMLTFDLELLNAVCEVECPRRHTNSKHAVFGAIPITSFQLFSKIEIKTIKELSK